MILRHNSTARILLCALLLLSLAAVRVSADDEFDCHVTIGDQKFDLTLLEGLNELVRERNLSPTKYRDTLTFNLCKEIQRSSASDNEQCPQGTRACLTKTNIKEGEPERITEVIQLATTSSDSVSYEVITSPTKGLSLSFKGPTYPDPYTMEPKAQSFNIRLICNKGRVAPKLKSYDGAALWVEWRTSAACPMGGPRPGTPLETKPDPDEGGENEETSVGSGLGHFFLLLLATLLVYFGLGAYYNYSTYGATGLDLIPHQNFWREVPYMLRDVVSHLCSAVRPRQAGREGYIAV